MTVLPDREHIVQLNADERESLRKFLEQPNGSWSARRATVEAVVGGGILIRTKPYGWGRQ